MGGGVHDPDHRRVITGLFMAQDIHDSGRHFAGPATGPHDGAISMWHACDAISGTERHGGCMIIR